MAGFPNRRGLALGREINNFSRTFPLSFQSLAAEFTNLEDAFNFALNRSGKNGGEFEGGWTPAKYDAFAKWIDTHPEKLKMPRAEFNAILEKKKDQ